LIESFADDQLSLGDFVISGGELAAAVVIDAVLRLLPGVLGHEMSAQQDSFSDGLLDCPHYTRPEEVDGRRVPQVLIEGNHAAIRRWRLKEALGRTWLRRPDLLEQRMLTDEEIRLLDEYKSEHESTGNSHNANSS
jgi:tRNA (guanine37-N1)-methyltransferase